MGIGSINLRSIGPMIPPCGAGAAAHAIATRRRQRGLTLGIWPPGFGRPQIAGAFQTYCRAAVVDDEVSGFCSPTADAVGACSNRCCSLSAMASSNLRTGRCRYGLTSFVTGSPLDRADRLAPIPASEALWIARITKIRFRFRNHCDRVAKALLNVDYPAAPSLCRRNNTTSAT